AQLALGGAAPRRRGRALRPPAHDRGTEPGDDCGRADRGVRQVLLEGGSSEERVAKRLTAPASLFALRSSLCPATSSTPATKPSTASPSSWRALPAGPGSGGTTRARRPAWCCTTPRV